jgi:hypothetical protein
VKRVPLTALLLIAIIGWLGAKLVGKEFAAHRQAQRFVAQIESMPAGVQPFILEEFNEIHPDAFRDSHSLWQWWPLDEFRLTSTFDQRRYFTIVHDHIVGAATREGETRAIPSISSLAPQYGIPTVPGLQRLTPPSSP